MSVLVAVLCFSRSIFIIAITANSQSMDHMQDLLGTWR